MRLRRLGPPAVLLAGVILLALPGGAAGQGAVPGLAAYLPTAAELAPHRLNGVLPEPLGAFALSTGRCDTVPVEGVKQILETSLPREIVPVENRTLGRITLYAFASPAEARRFVDCAMGPMNRSGEFTVRTAPYGDRGFQVELSPGASRGTSILFHKGGLVVSVDALENLFESAAAHGVAKTVEQRAGPPSATASPRTPGLEAPAAALAALAAAAWMRGRRAG